MQCPSPISLPHPHGTTPAMRLSVPCGKCVFCLSNKRNDWSFRLNQELKTADSAHFITLTYSDETLPLSDGGRPQLSKRDAQLFIKRLRKHQGTGKIRYYLVGEYGPKTKRPHYHAIIFNITPRTILYLEDIWQHGNIQVGTVKPASIHYVTKYVLNKYDDFQGLEKPFSLMSTSPGLGKNYLTRTKHWHLNNENYYVISENGTKQKLPRYYRDKLFTEKQKLAQQEKTIEKLDEEFEQLVKEFEKTNQDYFEVTNLRTQVQKEQITRRNIKSQTI
nr:MAG: replication initiation protein [Microvirus sp.]